jgi:hypothetical protein
MIIKEPYKKLAHDGQNVMRVDDPNDVEFLDKKLLEDSLEKDHFLCLISDVKLSDYTVNIMTIDPVNIKKESYICFETSSKKLIKGQVIDVI